MERLIAAAGHHVPVAHVAIALLVICVIAGLVYAVRSRRGSAQQSERGQEQSERDQGPGA
jgi:hypothetical protein